MPDLVELALLLLVGGGVAALIAVPFASRGQHATGDHSMGDLPTGEGYPPDRETLVIRHRVALDGLRDVELDHRAGSLDEAAYAEQRAAAERRAAETLAELEAAPGAPAYHAPAAPGRVPGRWVAVAAGLLAITVLAGFAAPAPIGLANPTRTNAALANQLAQEAERQATIRELLDRLSASPRDVGTLSQLADAYLEGATAADLSRGATVLLGVLALDPGNVSAYQRLITAYINAGDWTNASAATESYAKVAPASADVPFFRGIIALRGRNDRAAAVEQFTAFLAAAPDDPRAPMIRVLLTEARAGSSSVPPSPGG